MVNKLSDYGYNFQLKLIISLITDYSFLQQVIDVLETSFFESEANAEIVRFIKNYFLEFNSVPTLEVLSVKIKEIEDNVLKETVKDALKESYKHSKDTDLEFVKKQTVDFCKNQKLKHAILDSVEVLEKIPTDYEKIRLKIDEALKSGLDKNLGHNYKEDFDKRYEQLSRNCVKTGWYIIDDLLDGGLGPGELGVIVGSQGSGKSWVLCNIGANAIKNGYRVIHYTLELSDIIIGKRYDSILTGFALQNLKFHLDEVKDKVKKVKSNLIIKEYPSKTATLTTLAAHIDKSTYQKHKPDLIIVDYPDILKYVAPSYNASLRQDEVLGNLYVELRGLGGQYTVPVWAASQFNRSAEEMEIQTGDKIAGSYEKLMHADFSMSWTRLRGDRLANTARMHIIKNRFGPDAMTLPCRFDGATGKTQVFEPESIEGQHTQKEIDEGPELVRKKLGQRHKQLFNNNLDMGD